MQRDPLFDQQAVVTVVAGLLIALITFFTSYDHVELPGGRVLAIDQQGGIPLLLASVAALLGEAQLASRCRIRDSRDRIRAEEDRARDADEAARERDRARARAQRQTRCALAQLEHILEPGADTRRRLRAVIALLRDYGELA